MVVEGWGWSSPVASYLQAPLASRPSLSQSESVGEMCNLMTVERVLSNTVCAHASHTGTHRHTHKHTHLKHSNTLEPLNVDSLK